MGHLVHAKDEVYRALAERLNRNPVGAPVNETLMEILHKLYSETEALVGSKFPLLPMPLEKIAEITGLEQGALQNLLKGMAEKGLVLDLPRKDTTYYMLAPMVIGFFEYTFMRVRDNVNMKELAELFDRYFKNAEVREEFFGGDTKMFKALVYESLIPVAVETEVLTYEKATEVIRQSGGGSISMCSCRHKATHLGKVCDAPLEVCISLGSAGRWIVHQGLGWPATVEELLGVLELTEKHSLVHLCDNVLNKPAYICNCCGCCCQVLKAVNEERRLAAHPSNFIPELDAGACLGCGTCAESCQINAIDMQETASGDIPLINQELCLGCGVCAAACPNGSLTMARRAVLHVPPASKQEQFMRIAREKGRF